MYNPAYEALVKKELQQYLPGVALEEEAQSISSKDIFRLLGHASTLAFSEEPEERKKAYEISSRIAQLKGTVTPEIRKVVSFILARLGNFPSRNLLMKGCRDERDDKTSLLFDLEVVARESENTVLISEMETRVLTDFQAKLMESLDYYENASISAPMSAGKSFVFSLQVARWLKCGAESIVYVVPTRALIRQVMMDVIDKLKLAGLDEVPVRCVPIPLSAEDRESGVVYVLTQERLMSLLGNDEIKPHISILIVDEAQAIKDGDRGVLLQSAIDEVVKTFPKTKLFFLSPMVKNPACLLNLFQNHEKGASWREEISPVSQNIIFLDPVEGKPKHVDFSVLQGEKKILLGRRVVDFEFRNPKAKKIANTAVSVTQKGEITIVFANGPARAEQYACAISELLPEVNEVTSGVRYLIEYIRENIHDEYPLVKYLEKGVAYHYGHMPPLVRSTIEDLVCSQEIKYICCTSTLLQGINLPARNIVIENPKSGTETPMTRADFLNLSGRAGRLTYEFHGDVWCVNPASWNDSGNRPCYEGDAFQTIEPAFVSALKNGGELVDSVLHEKINAPQDKNHSLGVAVLNHILHGGERMSDISQLAESAEAKEKLIQTQQKIVSFDLKLPKEILKRHRGISPVRLQNLYRFIEAQVSIEDWIPLHPRETGAYSRMKSIFEQLWLHLGHKNNRSYEFHTLVANQWVLGTPMRQMIGKRISYLKENDRFKGVGESVLELLDVLENNIRFQYVKFMRAYCDVLSMLLESKGIEYKNIPPLHLYLECGSADACTLALISLGLSRSSALCVAKYINLRDDEATAKLCHKKLKQLNLNDLDFPKICKDEIERFI